MYKKPNGNILLSTTNNYGENYSEYIFNNEKQLLRVVEAVINHCKK